MREVAREVPGSPQVHRRGHEAYGHDPGEQGSGETQGAPAAGRCPHSCREGQQEHVVHYEQRRNEFSGGSAYRPQLADRLSGVAVVIGKSQRRESVDAQIQQ